MAAWAKADDEDRELEAIDIINKNREDNESLKQEYKELFYDDEILQAAFLRATSRLGKPVQMIFVTDKIFSFIKKGSFQLTLSILLNLKRMNIWSKHCKNQNLLNSLTHHT